jgi:nitrogen fixation/metabolism regulation signal transduction histidine kinase
VVKQDCAEVTAPISEMQVSMLLLAALLVALAILASLLTASSLVRPLRQLKTATDRISKGDLDVEIDIRSRDEIGDLADSFERMVAAIKFFRHHSRREEEELAAEEAAEAAAEAEAEAKAKADAKADADADAEPGSRE